MKVRRRRRKDYRKMTSSTPESMYHSLDDGVGAKRISNKGQNGAGGAGGVQVAGRAGPKPGPGTHAASLDHAGAGAGAGVLRPSPVSRSSGQTEDSV
jgi:hypothetical protein